MGVKRFAMSFEAQGNQTFGQDIPGFCWDIPGTPEKFEKNICVQFCFPKIVSKTHLNQTQNKNAIEAILNRVLDRD